MTLSFTYYFPATNLLSSPAEQHSGIAGSKSRRGLKYVFRTKPPNSVTIGLWNSNKVLVPSEE